MGIEISSLPDLQHQVALGARLDDTGGDDQAPVINPIPIIVSNPEIPVIVFTAL
jgi:hypothetical protein